eukprot:Plantae.Rhodophyta-Rhodochaete_pulchella.ctg6612.p3 GENE.Plantae.Rhodophyta-Rhodochaete_pulchella.ctg6612~~Plantae.Rhodophyta-Rhodochaete_pulchella.ctg6612.p3  ORF type:complete len:145 (+),score=21.01 Plantae.Rhodophyta-Rhodochaete_pulchella.ctg6612:342-776(+)
MIIDLAHTSDEAIRDVLAVATRPVFVSHTGIREYCQKGRNLALGVAKAIAEHGGLVCVTFLTPVVCGEPTLLESVAATIIALAEQIGWEHVCLGSDWDGMVRVAVGADGVGAIADELLRWNVSEPDVVAVMHDNLFRFIHDLLP